MKILGILNITEDSFSDGGKYLAPEAAFAHGRKLAGEGADILDIGAAASNPDAKQVSPETEIARLAVIVPQLKKDGIALSIDTFSAPVQAWALGQGVNYLNDIQGFAEPSLYPALAAANAKLVIMHSVQGAGKATRVSVPAAEIFDRVLRFFEARLKTLESAGVARTRLILDPGMGMFLGAEREASRTMLRRLPDLKAAFGLPVFVSVSRKSFLRPKGAPPGAARAASLGASTLAAELFALAQGADYIRTHDPAALRDAARVWANLHL